MAAEGGASDASSLGAVQGAGAGMREVETGGAEVGGVAGAALGTETGKMRTSRGSEGCGQSLRGRITPAVDEAVGENPGRAAEATPPRRQAAGGRLLWTRPPRFRRPAALRRARPRPRRASLCSALTSGWARRRRRPLRLVPRGVRRTPVMRRARRRAQDAERCHRRRRQRSRPTTGACRGHEGRRSQREAWGAVAATRWTTGKLSGRGTSGRGTWRSGRGRPLTPPPGSRGKRRGSKSLSVKSRTRRTRTGSGRRWVSRDGGDCACTKARVVLLLLGQHARLGEWVRCFLQR